MQFKESSRHGIKATVPAFNKKAQCSISTHHENSFGLKAAKLWNLLPKEVNTIQVLEIFKSSLTKFLKGFPDTPPTKGYTAITNNSLLEWTLQKDLSQEWLEDVLDTVVQKRSLPNLPKVTYSKYGSYLPRHCAVFFIRNTEGGEIANQLLEIVPHLVQVTR